MKISAINYKFPLCSNQLINTQINCRNFVSFGQRYDFFEKSINNESTNARFKEDNSSESMQSTDILNDQPFTGYVHAATNTGLAEGLGMIGFVGIPFILSLAMAAALAKNTNPEDIFLPDGTYLCNVNDLAVKSSKIEADSDDGILKIEGTGINIDKSRYDSNLSDPTKGIFKSSDGNLDIDLLNNKYIDKENGIFVDPDAKVSAFMTHAGELQSIPLPNFGSGYPLHPWYDDRWLTGNTSPNDVDEPIITMISEKVKNFIIGLKNSFNFNKENEKDLYNNSIKTRENSDGSLSITSVSDRASDYIKNNDLDSQIATQIVDYAKDIQLKEYMIDKYPSLADKVNVDSVDSFLQNLHNHGTNFDTASGLMDIVNDNNDI